MYKLCFWLALNLIFGLTSATSQPIKKVDTKSVDKLASVDITPEQLEAIRNTGKMLLMAKSGISADEAVNTQNIKALRGAVDRVIYEELHSQARIPITVEGQLTHSGKSQPMSTAAPRRLKARLELKGVLEKIRAERTTAEAAQSNELEGDEHRSRSQLRYQRQRLLERIVKTLPQTNDGERAQNLNELMTVQQQLKASKASVFRSSSDFGRGISDSPSASLSSLSSNATQKE